MKPFTKVLIVVFLMAVIAQSCSRKKDNFINRAWHSVGTEYNILYNGEIALNQGLETVNNAFTENFWELLPVERFEAKDEVRLANKAENSDFERAEEKAVKAIQKHSMIIKGKEKNPQIDEAYLLLGKARYYDQRFVPALAAFNNILNKYPSSDKINQVKVWREKTNLRLGNPELTIKNLKRHLSQEDIEGQDLADITAVLAEAYLTLKHKDTALKYLDTAAVATKINAQKARYNFIRGQLYDEFGKKDSANMAYDILIDMHRKIPRAFYINAHLAKSNNFDAETGNKLEFLEYLTALEENRENRPFLHKIYHRIAKYHQSQGRDSLSEAYYNKSIAKNKTLGSDKVLFARNYLTLGDMYFDRTEYKTAGAYYDSTLTNMVEKTKPYRVVAKKRKNLDDVIYYEGIAKVNDSILDIVKLSKEEQILFFNDYIKTLKTKDSLNKVQEEKALNRAANNSSGLSGNGLAGFPGASNRNVPGLPGSNTGGNSDFYFYNQTTSAYGKDEFFRLWGDRKPQDNWRLSSGSKGVDRSQDVNADNEEIVTQLELYNPEYYISKLPTDKVVLDSLSTERNFAYYQLGLIYKEKFQEYILAKEKLENLLKSNPEERLIIPSKYNLVKIYELLGQMDEYKIAKNKLIAEHPDSRYAEILRNPNSQLAKDENNPETVYENLYRKFENQDYSKVIIEADESIKRFEGDSFIPKFEILKASAIGRLRGFEAYEEAVNYVALTYPNSEEGKRAQEILNNALPLMKNKEFLPEDEGNSFYVVYQFNNSEKEDIKEFTEELSKIMQRLPYKDISLSEDVYDESTTFVVVHGLTYLTSAMGFGPTLEDYTLDDERPITKKYITISSANYAIIQRHKNLNDYINPE